VRRGCRRFDCALLLYGTPAGLPSPLVLPLSSSVSPFCVERGSTLEHLRSAPPMARCTPRVLGPDWVLLSGPHILPLAAQEKAESLSSAIGRTNSLHNCLHRAAGRNMPGGFPLHSRPDHPGES
jgi:hypothetical protein